jgi:hypothetical protein
MSRERHATKPTNGLGSSGMADFLSRVVASVMARFITEFSGGAARPRGHELRAIALTCRFVAIVAPVAYTGGMEEMLDTNQRHRLYGLAAEIRAVEEGHNARVLPDGSLLVKAESGPGSYRVVLRRIGDGVLWFGCSCRSGEYRTSLPVPCKHAALAARRLEREGLARWEDGTWRLRERAQVRGARLLLARTVQRRPALVAPPMADAA